MSNSLHKVIFTHIDKSMSMSKKIIKAIPVTSGAKYFW